MISDAFIQQLHPTGNENNKNRTVYLDKAGAMPKRWVIFLSENFALIRQFF